MKTPRCGLWGPALSTGPTLCSHSVLPSLPPPPSPIPVLPRGLAHPCFRRSSNGNSEGPPHLSICSRLYLPSHHLHATYFNLQLSQVFACLFAVHCVCQKKLQEGKDLIRPVHGCVSRPQGTADTWKLFESRDSPWWKSHLHSWPHLSALPFLFHSTHSIPIHCRIYS